MPNTITTLKDLFGLIEEVYEVQKGTLFKEPKNELQILKEQFLNERKEISMTLQAIPEISVTELGWTDVQTRGDKEMAVPARYQLLQFVSQIIGYDLHGKVQSLAEFYSNP